MRLSKVRFSKEKQIREIPMGKLNIKQRISAKPADEPETPIKLDVLENETIQEDRWDTFNEENVCFYGLMIEAISEYTFALEEAFEIYLDTGLFEEASFDSFEDSYNEYLDYIEEMLYDCFDEFPDEEESKKCTSEVPYVIRDDISSIKSDDSCQCVNCKSG